MSGQKIVPQHVLVRKIIRIDKNLDKDGKPWVRDPNSKKVKDPKTDKWTFPPTEKLDVVEEAIRIDEIKSARPYFKSKLHKEWLIGDVTLLYLKADETKKPFEVQINENFNVFCKRVGVIFIPEEED